MDNLNYNKKYEKYKNKCDLLTTKLSSDFYFSHQVADINALKNILKDEKLKKGSELKKSQRKLSGGIPKDYIFCNIHFHDSKIRIPPTSLVIDSSVIKHNPAILNNGWYADTKEDSFIIKDTKDICIAKQIYDNEIIPNFKKIPLKIMSHEILFGKNINVKKYVSKIVCYYMYEEKIRRWLKKYGYDDIEIVSVDDKYISHANELVE